ncbi:MAG: HAMP domain-containing histidine kinase, partial [Oscillospiraceae bacterium]|nr:HAMP domain-containing histidine kinase [Oscillospiraceae bacterium]
MNRQDRKQRFTLTVFFSAIVFAALLVTLIITGLLVYLLTRWGVFVPDGQASLSYRAIIAMMMGLSLIIGTTISLAVIRIPMNPVNSIVNGMKELAGGNYKARINMGRIMGRFSMGDEMVNTFNTLASELENTQMLRSDFINNFSHEFKTPIVSIAGFAKLLKRGQLSENEKNEYLDIIEQEALRLSDMATNVLNLTRVENQSILSGQTEYNLSEQLRTCVLLLENKWEKKNSQLELDFDEHSITANEELMKQVWLNLLDNAIKFSPVGGIVELHVSD